MELTYIGPHEAVLIPHDQVPGGEIVVKQGETVDIPDELAQGLLDQGRDSAESAPRHQPQWKKATTKKAADESAAKAGSK